MRDMKPQAQAPIGLSALIELLGMQVSKVKKPTHSTSNVFLIVDKSDWSLFSSEPFSTKAAAPVLAVCLRFFAGSAFRAWSTEGPSSLGSIMSSKIRSGRLSRVTVKAFHAVNTSDDEISSFLEDMLAVSPQQLAVFHYEDRVHYIAFL